MGRAVPAPACDPRKFSSAPRGPRLCHVWMWEISPFPQEKAFPAAVPPNKPRREREHPTQGAVGDAAVSVQAH